MRLGVVENLQPVLHGAQECVCAFQHGPFLIGEGSRFSEPADRLQGVAGAHAVRLTTAEQLQKLDRKLDVTDAPPAILDIGARQPGGGTAPLHPAFEGLNAADIGPGEPASVDPRLHFLEQPLAQRDIASHTAGLDPRLPFPGAA